MTRINNPSGLSSRPDSVAMCELVVGAGLAGHGLTICFDRFPAVVLSEVYSYCIRGATAPAVLRVHSQRDVKNLEQRMEAVRLVLVDSERLLAETQWAIHMESAASVQGEPVPAVLCSCTPSDPENLPGATLVVCHSENEFAAIREWRRQANAIDSTSVEVRIPQSIEFDQNVLSAIERFERASALTSEQQISTERILVGLLVGASVIRLENAMSSETDITVTSDDYRLVRARLQRVIIGSADIECDPLAVDMVQRTNVYLGIRFGRDTSPDDPLWASEGEYIQLKRSGGRKPPVTRREIADLGNTKSGLVNRLVTSLQQRMDDGYRQFGKLGLVRRLPPERDWSRASPADLAKYLKPWSVKQVRTHFEVLQRQGLVTAEREHDNGPWQYELPEALTTNGSPFAGLPPLEH